VTALAFFLVGLLLGLNVGACVALATLMASPELRRFVADLVGDPGDDDGRLCAFNVGDDGSPCPEPWASRESCVGCPYLLPRGVRHA
jgi:hypothetical protein